MAAEVKSSKAFDVIINNKNDIEVKSINSNDNIPFAFQKRDKIPFDNVEITVEKEKTNSYRTSSTFSVSTLSNLPYDERPVPTLYNKIKKEKAEKAKAEKIKKEERAYKTLSLMDILSEEKKAQLSWKKSVDDGFGLRPKSVVSRSSAAYDRKLNRSSMTIMAEVINSDYFDSGSEIYPAECIASSIEEIKSNLCQVENSSVHTSIVTQEQVKHLSHQSISLPTLENKIINVPQLTISLVSESDSTKTPSTEEHKLLDYNTNSNQQKNKKGKKSKTKTDKKSKKVKKSNDTALCQCVIS
ncbi:hypothetical protein BCR36DRAFT_366062 [Piromyces finnis]|uniref:Uncharacterized protein n=1 Tax=Piromyces finnis TaxID=1754191 RepID=A0A1Y1VMB7_9FUNG|nr:hypothetical protein BCR36DRAFT_366062 [Piromyces finnis]|eukprot:ORX60063.1 hypothetical protein BCR36DRAFT_366062 [Piromyces finnis]